MTHVDDELFGAHGCDFLIRWTAEHEYRVLFEVFEVVARTLQPDNVTLGPPQFTRAGSDDAFNTTTRVEEAAVLARQRARSDAPMRVGVLAGTRRAHGPPVGAGAREGDRAERVRRTAREANTTRLTQRPDPATLIACTRAATASTGQEQ